MGKSRIDDIPESFRRHLSDREIQKTSILHSFDAVKSQLKVLEGERDVIDSILDVGCNRGGLVLALADHLDADTVYGIDTDETVRRQAAENGVDVFDVDVECDSFPLEDGSVDLVTSFGLLEHLRYYDTLFEQCRRVLGTGWFWIATPNLGSWINRLSLMTGHQPRNVELSSEIAVGTLSIYDDTEFLDHVHAPTYGTLIELLEYYGFDPVDSAPLSPYQRSTLVRVLDWLFEKRITWSRRVAVLAKRDE